MRRVDSIFRSAGDRPAVGLTSQEASRSTNNAESLRSRRIRAIFHSRQPLEGGGRRSNSSPCPPKKAKTVGDLQSAAPRYALDKEWCSPRDSTGTREIDSTNECLQFVLAELFLNGLPCRGDAARESRRPHEYRSHLLKMPSSGRIPVHLKGKPSITDTHVESWKGYADRR